MKLAIATLFFAAPAAAFTPSASFGVNSALKMSTEAATEKVRRMNETEREERRVLKSTEMKIKNN